MKTCSAVPACSPCKFCQYPPLCAPANLLVGERGVREFNPAFFARRDMRSAICPTPTSSLRARTEPSLRQLQWTRCWAFPRCGATNCGDADRNQANLLLAGVILPNSSKRVAGSVASIDRWSALSSRMIPLRAPPSRTSESSRLGYRYKGRDVCIATQQPFSSSHCLFLQLALLRAVKTKRPSRRPYQQVHNRDRFHGRRRQYQS